MPLANTASSWRSSTVQVIQERKLYGNFINRETAQSKHSALQGSPPHYHDIDYKIDPARILREIKDIRDEIKILSIIAKQQQSVQNECHEGESAHMLSQAVIDQLHALDKDMGHAEASVKLTLTLEQSEVSNAQAKAAVYQGRIILVFTLTTILFVRSYPRLSFSHQSVCPFSLAKGVLFLATHVVPYVIFRDEC